jgi:N utilization substance protein A
LNARLATRLTGWKIDIQSEQEFAQAEAEAAFGGGGDDGEEFSGRCAAILSNGKRCPNAALPGSRHCGVPAHQELANQPEPADAADEAEQSDDELVEEIEAVEEELEVVAVAEEALVEEEESREEA